MRAQSRRIWQGLALAGAVTLPAVGALLGGIVQVTRCVALPDGVAHLGIRLALLRTTADCPTTGLALGGEQEQILGVALVLTLPMLLLHVVAVSGGCGALRALRQSLARLARLTPWQLLPYDSNAPVAVRLPPARRAVEVLHRSVHLRVPLLRGPPAAAPV